MANFLINEFEADLAYDYLNEHIGEFNRIKCLDRITGDKKREELNDYANDIIDFIDYKSNSEKDKKEIITNLKKEITNQRLSTDDLIWIDKDNIRLCNWLYILIKKTGSSYKFRNINIEKINLDRSYHTSIERYNNIINALRELNESKKDKILFISKLKDIWSNDIVKYTKIKNLIDKNNNNQTIWAYNYIEKTFNFNKELRRAILPVNNDNDYYHIIIAYFDSIENSYEKNDKFNSLKNAWSQKKYRDGNNGKKSYNFNMSVDIADKLAVLSISSNRSKNYIVEELINNEYLKLKK